MSIVLNWANLHGTVPDQIKILRSNSRTGTFVLLATLAGDQLTYTDTTTAINTVYFYRIDTIVGTDTAQSQIIPFANFPNTGPGPTTLLRGDWEFGYFGSIDPSLFFTQEQIATASGVVKQNQTTLQYYHKWIVGGRIIFISGSMFVRNVRTYDGMGKMFIYPAGRDRITYGLIMTKGSNNYLIRAPYATNKFTTENNPNGELSDIYYNGSYRTMARMDSTLNKSELVALLVSFNVSGRDTLLSFNNINDLALYMYDLTTEQIITNTYLATGLTVAYKPGGAPMGLVSNQITTNSTLFPIFELQL